MLCYTSELQHFHNSYCQEFIMQLLVLFHSRPQRLIYGLSVILNMLRVKSDKSDWLRV